MAEAEAVKLDVLKEALYDAVQGYGDDKRLFTQADLLALDILPDPNDVLLLAKLVGVLVRERLFVAVNDTRVGLAWRFRSRQDADKYAHLPTEDQRMVYSMIDEAGADGIWTRTLKARLGMHDSVFKAAVKALESRGYVSQLKSVEAVNKKMLIRADLRPSDRATGGPWYTDSDLDEAFIALLEVVIFDYITRESAWRGKEEVDGGKGGRTATPKKGVVHGGTSSSGVNGHGTETGSAAEFGSKGRKRGADAISTETPDLESTIAAPVQPPTKKASRREVLLPYAAGYTSYPTVRDIAELIDKSGITNNTTLSEEDVQQLVDVLVYDGVIEPVKMGREAPPKPLPSDSATAAAARNGGLPAEEETVRRKKQKGKRKIGYRTTRIAKQDLVPAFTTMQEWRDKGLDDSAFEWPGSADRPTNGFVEVPCGRCPVFELCEEGGPVNPSNCEYFQRWLGKEVS